MGYDRQIDVDYELLKYELGEERKGLVWYIK